jgi:hypothetical protein
VNNGYSGEDFEATVPRIEGKSGDSLGVDSLEAQVLAMEQSACATIPQRKLRSSSSLADTRRLLATAVWPDSSNR